ncbi:MAG: PH domain-containing protein [Phycisphaerales bacterium]
MRQEVILQQAEFDNAVKYFVLSIAVPFTCTIILIPLLIIILPIVYIVRTIEYKHIECTLLERSLRVRRGVLNKVEKTIPLDKITDLGVNQGPIMRYCGVQAIAIETAGQSGMGSSLVNLVGIRDAKGFRDAVLERRDEIAEGKSVSSAPTATAPASSDDATELIREIRDTLARIETKLGQSD